jgi:hypothetical protein
MMDAFLIAGLVILYCAMIYIIEVKILKIDPYKNPWEGDL